MMQIRRLFPAALLCAALAQPSGAAVPAASVQAHFGLCLSCHGADGHAVLPSYPNLAGQNRDYLIQALKDFRAGTRPSSVMAPMASSLSDTDIDQIATYFASLRRR